MTEQELITALLNNITPKEMNAGTFKLYEDNKLIRSVRTTFNGVCFDLKLATHDVLTFDKPKHFILNIDDVFDTAYKSGIL